MSRNGGRLKGSQLGYHGKGVPDEQTILQLQQRYGAAVEKGGLPPETLSKLKRMRTLMAMLQQNDENQTAGELTKAREEAGRLAEELAPVLHFKVDEVDWDK